MIDQMRDMILDLQRRVAALEAMFTTPQIPQPTDPTAVADPDRVGVAEGTYIKPSGE